METDKCIVINFKPFESIPVPIQGEDAYIINLTNVNLIGETRNSRVYKIYRKYNNQVYAGKIIYLPNSINIDKFVEKSTEIALSKRLNLPFAVKLVDNFIYQKRRICLVFEFISGGDL